MAFDENLASRIRTQLGKKKGLTEKKMFGGLAFMLNGNMSCGVHKSEMIVRLAPEETDKALSEKHTRIFDLSGGRPMKGWILIEPEGVKTDKELAKWVETGVKYAASLPPK
ncbi:MAG TPA: TfoX/Sxy family protein [Gemmatimonadaceae bacterium]|nr:TfoX/Sxy family protein [Gemmatimonadaceae bacterium]